MAQYFAVHPENPQPRLIRAAVDIIRGGGVVAYPTDSCYALGCHIGDKSAMERLRRIRDVDERHHFTLLCRNLSEVGQFAKVDNLQFRLIRANTPGSYTFILRATRACRGACCIRGTRSACAFPTIPWRWRCSTRWANRSCPPRSSFPRMAWPSTTPRRSGATSSTSWTS
jgi:tRNA A37 threonylcarbamoyladenosine synthetase subunit TsaC/SUA5/YrdC